MSGNKVFKSASECVRALRQITSHAALMKQDKRIYADLLSEANPFVSEMNPQDLRVLAKSVLIVYRKFGLNLNNYLFKLINKQLNFFIDSSVNGETRHALTSTMSALSHIKREVSDGGPPALRPDTVWKFAHAPTWRSVWQQNRSVFDKAELLSLLSRLNLRPFSHLVFAKEELSNDSEPNAIFFSSPDLTELLEEGKSANGRLVGSLHAMSKLDMYSSPAFNRLMKMIPSRISDLSPSELGNSLHAVGSALALQPYEDKEISEELAVNLIRTIERRKRDIPLSVVNQVGLVHFANPDLVPTSLLDLRAFCQEAVKVSEKDDKVNEIRVSKAQKVIRNAIDLLGLSELVKEEYPVGPFRIDFAIPHLRLAIEINGPYHYYYKTTEPTTKTRLKHKALAKKGFTVLEIDYLEMKNEGDRVSLMDGRIRDALGIGATRRSLRTEVLSLVNHRNEN